MFYDHPPSSGSYKAASIPEPPEDNINNEVKDHLYDEIPCWKLPLQVCDVPSILSNESFYVNTETEKRQSNCPQF